MELFELFDMAALLASFKNLFSLAETE